MKILNRFFHRFNSYMTHTGRVKTRKVLLTFSDRMLEDAGFSRELLESGVKAWPWHLNEPMLPAMDFEQYGNVKHKRQSYGVTEQNDLAWIRVRPQEVEMTGQDSLKSGNERQTA